MSIQFGDILKHNNLVYPIVDINDVKGGLRSIATFSSPALVSEYASIPEKYRSGYSLLLETSTGTIYYLAGLDATNKFHWSPVGIGGNGTGVANAIPKWTSSSILGNSNITDNGDTVTINGNLQVIGTTSTISSENLLVKDPIILLAGSQSGTPTYDAGLFVNRGSSDTQAFIWDESMDEFKFITTTSGATTSGDVSIGTYSNVRTGVLRVGTQSVDSNDRFVVSSSGGTISLIVDENGYVYNRGKGGIATNTAFGFMTLGTNTTGSRNTAFGASALSVNTTGSYNTALGQQALMVNLSGSYNTAIGHQSLNQNIFGAYNIGIGANSLRYNRSNSNTAIGYNSLFSNTLGTSNTAVGYQSLLSNTSEILTFGTITPGSGYVPGTYSNVQLIYATGSSAISYPKVEIVVDGSGVVTSVTPGTSLGSGFPDSTTRMTISNSFLGGSGSGFEVGIGSLSTGDSNTAVGSSALQSNTTGDSNTAIGLSSLQSNTIGNENVGIGLSSLQNNTTANGNVSVGKMAMLFNTTGSYNTAFGWQALPRNTTSDRSCAFGRNTLFYSRTGSENSGFGDATLYYNTLGNNNTGIGSQAGFYNTTGVASLGTFSGGNGYTPGTYSGVQLKYSSGTFLDGVLADYPLATIVVGSTGSITSVSLESSGQCFQNTSTIMTSTASIIGPGNGFTIQINSIQSANNNTVIGYNSLYFNTIGSNNTALGFHAGSFTTLGNNSISDNSIFIGYNTRANLSNETNQIVIGYDAIGNGSNTVTLGNDSITKTYLKGAVYVGTATINSNDRLVVSSSGIASLIVSSDGSVYNRGKGSISTNTVFGASALSVNTSGYNNTAIGVNTLLSNTVGHGNTALGASALAVSTGNANQNTAVGSQALYSNISGSSNTAVGFESLRQNIAANNTAVGYQTLLSNTTGTGNVAFGYMSLYSSNANFNTAIGYESLILNTANSNTAVGYQTLATNTTGAGNVAIGSYALRINNKDENVAIGAECLYFSTTGIFNVGIGSLTLYSNTTGAGNTVIGYNSLALNTIGDFNVAIGYQSGPGVIGATNSSNSIYIGNSAGRYSNGYNNEIIIGSTMSYGDNSVLLGNDSTTKTYLKGSVQLPTMTTTEINLVSGPTDGQVIYNTTLHQICFYNGSSWRKVTDSAM